MISSINIPRSASTLTGFDTDPHTCRISSPVRSPGANTDIRAGGLEGLEARDRVVQIGVATDVVLGPSRQHEREVEAVCRLGGCRDPIRGVGELVDPLARIVVFDRSADGRRPPPRARSPRAAPIGFATVAVLEVDRDGQTDRSVQLLGMLDDLVQCDVAVQATLREGEPGAGAGHRP
jgi:hypothetical protein